jgi:hypothetical protein
MKLPSPARQGCDNRTSSRAGAVDGGRTPHYAVSLPQNIDRRRECENRQISHGRETALLCPEPGKRVKCNLVDEIIGLWAPSDAAIRAIE